MSLCGHNGVLQFRKELNGMIPVDAVRLWAFNDINIFMKSGGLLPFTGHWVIILLCSTQKHYDIGD